MSCSYCWFTCQIFRQEHTQNLAQTIVSQNKEGYCWWYCYLWVSLLYLFGKQWLDSITSESELLSAKQMTLFSELFCPTNNPKPKDSLLTIIRRERNKEKQKP